MFDNAANGNASLPPMRTRRVLLRPIDDRDHLFLYELMSSPLAGGRVRFAGATPSPEQIAATLWEHVLAQFVIEGAGSRVPLGIAAVTSPNMRDAYAYISALGAPAYQGSGLVLEGVLLAVNYAFSCWPFRKLYLEAGEDSFRHFRSGSGRLFAEEGRLREHHFWNGRYTDLVILAVYRTTWAQLRPRFLRRFGLSDHGLATRPAVLGVPGGPGEEAGA